MGKNPVNQLINKVFASYLFPRPVEPNIIIETLMIRKALFGSQKNLGLILLTVKSHVLAHFFRQSYPYFKVRGLSLRSALRLIIYHIGWARMKKKALNNRSIEYGSKMARDSVFDCHLSPVR